MRFSSGVSIHSKLGQSANICLHVQQKIRTNIIESKFGSIVA